MHEIFFPNTISINTIKCYQIEKVFSCTESQISCQNFGEWCRNLPRSLKELCIQSIVDNWKDHPKLQEICSPEDKCMLLNVLPTNLPLESTVPKIRDNIYWKKCSLERWPHLMPMNIAENYMFIFKSPVSKEQTPKVVEEFVSDMNCTKENEENISEIYELFTEMKNWKQYYLENHMKEYLEKMKPEEYDAEQMKIICDICAPFIKSLQIEELKCLITEESSTRIPIGSVLTGLPLLQNLSICFKQKYIGFQNFNWGAVELPAKDIHNLAKGLEKIKLRTLRIINSGIDGIGCISILKSIKRYDNLKVLDFSYCNLEDEGAISVCKFITEMNIRDLLLVDNNIGDEGAEAVAFILHRPECTLEYLNVKMNPIGSKGGNTILKSLLLNNNLKILDISACRIEVTEIIANVLRKCTCLQELNLSNNTIGNEIGNLVLNSMKYNRTLKKIDLRMCQIHSELQQKINDTIKDAYRLKVFVLVEETECDIEFSEKCRQRFEKISEKN